MSKLVLRSFFIIVCVFFLNPQTNAQFKFNLDVNLELTAANMNPNVDPERKINTNFRNDDPFNPVRAKFFPGFWFDKSWGIEGDILLDTKATKFGSDTKAPLRVDGLFFAYHGEYDKRLNIWVGKIPTPVGTFSPRSYSHINPLIGFPLAYAYKVPYNVFTLSSEASNLTLRDNNFGAATSIYEACWITGISVFGDFEEFGYSVTAGRGTLTNPEAKENGGFQLAARIKKNITENLTIGCSAGIAPYLQHEPTLSSGFAVRDPKHFIGGIDVSAHLSSLKIFFEFLYNSWDTPQYQYETSVKAYSWYLEGQYVLFDNLYAAARFDQMLYNTITDPSSGSNTPWGYDVTRLEAGIGFSPFEQLNIKSVVQQNWLENPSSKSITILALQGTFRFENLLEF
ncbi:MAG: hypothetical protein HYZ34_09810 [Ignavibacteriae bacterium]|nr:hypothetical protein [Ignavibacteriota bacterium]